MELPCLNFQKLSFSLREADRPRSEVMGPVCSELLPIFCELRYVACCVHIAGTFAIATKS